AQHGEYKTCAGVPRHVDADEALYRSDMAALLHVVPGIVVVDQRREGEVVDRRRRGSRPFQRTAVPWITCRIAQRLAPYEADHQLDDERQDAKRDQEGAKGRDLEPDL